MADTLPTPTLPRVLLVLLLVGAAGLGRCAWAQAAQNQSDPRALAAVRAAVASQLEADRTDRTNWIYIDHDVTPDHDTVSLCAGSPNGELRIITQKSGQPASMALTQSEHDRIERYIHDPDAQARNRRNADHDDVQATQLLKMLPDAFLWTVASDTPEYITLNYRPNPNFDGPDMEARVMSLMAGQLVVTHKGNLIRSLRGTLTEEFRIGFGILGHLNKGGSIDIERRDVGAGHWEITETHVHIGGKALFFKSIGTQQDEVKTDWRPSPAQNLQEAAHLLGVQP